MEAICKILGYLKRTLEKDLPFKGDEHLKVVAHTDVDWARAVNDRRPTLGFCAMIGGNLVM